MAKIRIVSIDYEGDSPDEVLRQALAMISQSYDPATAAPVAAIERNTPEVARELPPPTSKMRSPRKSAPSNRLLTYDERPGETFTVQQAAELAAPPRSTSRPKRAGCQAGFAFTGRTTERTGTAVTAFVLDPLWKAYLQEPSDANRNALMLKYLHIVAYHAARVSAATPDCVEEEDLRSDGFFGLRDAIESFDPFRGVKFGTFCARRVRGAMIDALRDRDWMPQSARRRGDDRQLLSLSWPNEEGEHQDFIEDHRESENHEVLRQMVRCLPRDLRLIVALYYCEDLNRKEIGKVLGVSESRVSQMHAQALQILKAEQNSAAEERSS